MRVDFSRGTGGIADSRLPRHLYLASPQPLCGYGRDAAETGPFSSHLLPESTLTAFKALYARFGYIMDRETKCGAPRGSIPFPWEGETPEAQGVSSLGKEYGTCRPPQ